MTMTEAEAYDAILAHHAALNADVNMRVSFLGNKVEKAESEKSAIEDLVRYLNAEVVPHAIAEEHTIYQTAVDKLGLADLIGEMTTEHKTLVSELTALENSSSGQEALEHADRFAVLFSDHVTKENELIVPRLLDSGDVDLTLVLSEMHQLFEAAQESAASASPDKKDPTATLLKLLGEAAKELAKSGKNDLAARLTAGAWAALQVDRPDLATKANGILHRLVDLRSSAPVAISSSRRGDIERELDVRPLAPAQRHSEIFAAYRSLGPGNGFLLINDHDPKPLQYQFEAEYQGQFTWDYLESGPKVWRVRIGRPS